MLSPYFCGQQRVVIDYTGKTVIYVSVTKGPVVTMKTKSGNVVSVMGELSALLVPQCELSREWVTPTYPTHLPLLERSKQ